MATTAKPSGMADTNGKPTGAAIYRALVTQAKGSVRGARLVKKENPSAGKYAALMVRGKHVAYVHQSKRGATVEIRVDGKRVVHKLTSEKDVAAAAEAIAAKASQVTAKKEAK
jgi:hypothetical protein